MNPIFSGWSDTKLSLSSFRNIKSAIMSPPAAHVKKIPKVRTPPCPIINQIIDGIIPITIKGIAPPIL